MPKLMFGRVFHGGVYTGRGLCTIWNNSHPSSWGWSDTQANVSRQWLKVNQHCILSWLLESRKKWKLLSPALPYAKVLLTFMIFPPFLFHYLSLCLRASERTLQILDCFQSFPLLMMDYHVNLNGIGLICFNDFSLGWMPVFFSISLLALQKK